MRAWHWVALAILAPWLGVAALVVAGLAVRWHHQRPVRAAERVLRAYSTTPVDRRVP